MALRGGGPWPATAPPRSRFPRSGALPTSPPPPLSPSLASAAAVACAAYSEPLRVLREVGQVDGVRLEEGKRVE